MNIIKRRKKIFFIALLLLLLSFAFVNVYGQGENINNNKDIDRFIEVLDKYKNKSEITIYDIEELLEISDSSNETNEDTDEENYDFLEMLYTILGEEDLITEESSE